MPNLDWIGKAAVERHHREVPYRLLHCDRDASAGDPDAENILVRGDNLHGLKALLPFYGGCVKVAYLDPPYNTGNEKWVYNDAVNSPEIREWLGKVVGAEMEDLTRHDKWLCMMYPRLRLVREMLREDGVVMVSIDDSEVANLVLLMNEIFGSPNFIATLVWEKGKKGDAKFVSVNHEYVIIFARNKAALKRANTRWRRRKPGVDETLAYYQELRVRYGADHDTIRTEMMAWYRGLPAGHPAKAHKHYNWSDDRGLYFAADFAGPDDGRQNRPRYDILHPVTGLPCKKPSTGWRWEEERTKAALAEQPPRIHFGPDHTTIPNRKSYLFEIDQEPFPSVFYKDGRAATLQVEALLGNGAFNYPKDSDVLAELIGLAAGPEDLVLDCFAGSGTTGHAVLKLNKADGGRRRFVLVEMDDTIATTITAPRLRRVIEGYTDAKGTDVPGLGGGVRVCTLGEPLFDERGQIRDRVQFRDLAAHVFFAATKTPLPRRVTARSPYLGAVNGVAVYLLFNGVMGDVRPDAGNVLNRTTLSLLPPHEGPRIVYGEACTLSAATLRKANITFRQLPYSVQED